MRRAGLAACALLVACGRPAPRATSTTLQDDWDRTVALAAPARRIVSLAPATTELVFALGLGGRLVGRTTWCDWPPAAHEIPDVGNGISPNVEAIVARRPDLVLVYPSEANRAAVAQLTALGIPTAVLAQDALADWRRTARWIARAGGVPARGDSLVRAVDSALAAVRAPDAASGPRVFIAVDENPPIAIGAGSFLSELLTLAGARNAFSDLRTPSAVVSLEAVVARDPDVVLVLGPDSVTRAVGARPGWRAIPAVRTGRVVAVDGSAFDRPSPRLPDAVRILEARLAALRERR